MFLFGKNKPTVDVKSTISELRQTVTMIEKREDHLNSKIKKEGDLARKLVDTNRDAALVCLKRKKLYTSEVEKMISMRMNVETQIIAIENASFNVETTSVMKRTNTAMANLHKSTDLNSVDQTMDDARDQIDNAK